MKREAMRTVAILLAATLPTASTVDAEQLDLETARTAVISMSGNSRILVAFPSLAELDEEWISTATLRFPLSGAGGRWTVPVEVNGLGRSWGAGASWTSPWETPGGDLEDAVPASTEPVLTGAAGDLVVDVTDIVRAMVAGEIGDHGFILLPLDVRRMGFSAAEMALLGSMPQARLTVHYRSLTALGYRGGPQVLLDRRRTARIDADRPGR